MLLRYFFSCAMLTDTYQDTTFPVIAKRCGFDLWFVSAWLVVLGIGVMQVLAQLVSLLRTMFVYRYARTPEERERLMVEGAFLALRGSDNLVLVHAVRPAVEERLGGASSWAMKMSEARIAFFRFLFEDVEQSALQFVFLFFYEDANMADKVWVGLSAVVVPLLSLTLVVQCLPEVRDWLFYRVCSMLPGGRRFPIVRVPWILFFIVIYRIVSVFPWISACSPVGDPCKAGDDGMIGWIISCRDGEMVFFTLPVRWEVATEVIDWSILCVIGLAGAVLIAAFVWTSQKLYQRQKSGRWSDFQNYSAERRFASSGAILRPKTDEDDDHWLEDARTLRTLALQASAKDKSIDSGWFVQLVEAIDQEAFKLSRAPLPHRYPCRRVNIGRKLSPQLQRLGTSTILHSLGDAAKECASRLATEASHAQQVSYVRWNSQRLLSFHSFLHSSLVQKAHYIHDATGGYAPLRFIHWAQIQDNSIIGKNGEASPTLPKCGTPGGGNTVDEVLDRVSKRLGVTKARAERHIVPFFLSHRWLRTRGPKAWHHPDTEDNLKAKRLVTFAKWFMSLALQHNLRCEVVFWIDWCCTDQDELANMDLAVAALPLYIASCMKVVAWKTPDFERRCWTMVERLLSYSFCRGGLTPYVIDETFATDEDAPVSKDAGAEVVEKSIDVAEAATSVPKGADADRVRIWQVNLGTKWVDYNDVSQVILREARARGETMARLQLHGQNYEVDLGKFLQRNLKTGMERPIREQVSGLDFDENIDASMKTASEAEITAFRSAASVAEGRASGASVTPRPSLMGRISTTSSGMTPAPKFEEISAVINRRARKLPNPLDFDACQVTRLSDRRRVAQLVDIALTVPALEVFADRQPVEWGLTEVIEQSLAKREHLPNKWRDKREAPPAWLEPALQVKPDWELIIESASTKNKGRLHDSTAAIVWMDHSPLLMEEPEMPVPLEDRPEGSPDAPPPPPEAPPPAVIDQLFDDMEIAVERGGESLDKAIRALVTGLKADLAAAAATGNEATMEAAVLRTREVELPEKQVVCERICAQRLIYASRSGKEPVMRAALRMARQYGAEHLPIFSEVRNQQQKLYNNELFERLLNQLSEAALGSDILGLQAVSQTAGKHGLKEIQDNAWKCAISQVDELRLDGDLHGLMKLKTTAEECLWKDLAKHVDNVYNELTLEKAMEKAAAGDHIPELRAIEKRARETGYDSIADRAKRQVDVVAGRIGDRMGLPAEWDVVLELAGAPGTDLKLLKKSEEKEQALLDRVQKLVDVTFTGFGPAGKLTRTRDRAKEPIANRLEVMSVVYVQNSENYINFKARRAQVAERITSEVPVAAAWDIKTCRVPLEGVGRHKTNPVDHQINEYYLWHGTTPKAASAITDTDFDLKRAGSAYGALFGPGIYFAESCMKADEYTAADRRGWMPLILCRVVLGKINYCDAFDAKKLSKYLEDSCKPGGPFDSVLGDREKVRGTFREFIVFDNQQVYPEYIVWYVRRFS